MSKCKPIVFTLMITALLCWQVLPTGIGTAGSGVAAPDDFVVICSTAASIATEGACLLSCPIDFGLFGLDYPSPPKAYNPCMDFNCGVDILGPPAIIVGIVDFGPYGLHHFHNC